MLITPKSLKAQESGASMKRCQTINIERAKIGADGSRQVFRRGILIISSVKRRRERILLLRWNLLPLELVSRDC